AILTAVARSRRDLAARQTTSGDRVDVCVILRYPTLIGWTAELVAVPLADVAALVAYLARVLRSDVCDRNPSFSCFGLNALLKPSERPSPMRGGVGSSTCRSRGLRGCTRDPLTPAPAPALACRIGRRIRRHVETPSR
ncbi:MAG: hypothetical protein J07HQW2_00903, partial [Haloquadratum walsbyi J07HQW2]